MSLKDHMAIAAVASLSSLSIVIPAFNEQGNIREAVEAVTRGVGKCAERYEIIVVDDGSSDATKEILQELYQQYPQVRGIHHSVNCGKGAALRSGFAAATMEWILFMDSDLQTEIGALQLFIPHTYDHDMVIGFRTTRTFTLIRWLMTRGYTLILRLTLGLKVIDINCPFKLFRRTALPSSLISNGFFIDAELIYRAVRLGVSIEEVGIDSFPRKNGVSSVRSYHIFDIIGELLTVMRSKG